MIPAPQRSMRRIAAVALALGIAIGAVGLTSPASAASAPASTALTPRTVWLCLPGAADDPCAPSLTTTRVTGRGRTIDVQPIVPVADPKIDCFYVYPTVSDQPTPIANLDIDSRGALDRALSGSLLLAVLPGVRADVPAGDAVWDRARPDARPGQRAATPSRGRPATTTSSRRSAPI